jgi:hypothetical protein
MELAQVAKLVALPEVTNGDVALIKTLIAVPMTSTAALMDTRVTLRWVNAWREAQVLLMSPFLSLRLLLLKRFALITLAQPAKLVALPEVANGDVAIIPTLFVVAMMFTVVPGHTSVICPLANVFLLPARAYSLIEWCTSLKLLFLTPLALLELAQVPKLAALPEVTNGDVALITTLIAAPMTSTAALMDTPATLRWANAWREEALLMSPFLSLRLLLLKLALWELAHLVKLAALSLVDNLDVALMPRLIAVPIMLTAVPTVTPVISPKELVPREFLLLLLPLTLFLLLLS